MLGFIHSVSISHLGYIGNFWFCKRFYLWFFLKKILFNIAHIIITMSKKNTGWFEIKSINLSITIVI